MTDRSETGVVFHMPTNALTVASQDNGEENSRHSTHGFPDRACRIIRASRIPLTVVDITAPGQPLVIVNDKFLRLTGYEEAEVLGRNCSFLQNDLREQAGCGEINLAIHAGQATQVRLINFTKSGRKFKNLVFLYPLTTSDGMTRYYLGSQFDDEAGERLPYETRLRADIASVLSQTGFLRRRSQRTFSDTIATVLRSSL